MRGSQGRRAMDAVEELFIIYCIENLRWVWREKDGKDIEKGSLW